MIFFHKNSFHTNSIYYCFFFINLPKVYLVIVFKEKRREVLWQLQVPVLITVARLQVFIDTFLFTQVNHGIIKVVKHITMFCSLKYHNRYHFNLVHCSKICCYFNII